MAETRLFHVRATVGTKVFETAVDAIDPEMAALVAALEFDMTELPPTHTITEVTDEG